MKSPGLSALLCREPGLSKGRIFAALGVALGADGLQFILGPAGWILLDQAIDAVAMAGTMWLLGFNILLLPTFLLELIPGFDDLPTWTACVLTVIALRRRKQPSPNSPPTP